ncbi:TetR/AcrR family transcriptional regulator [Demetria terragena]|uniref:TetR/AcrR family transcriptional regulator n=1 Tax=Demetria terragena TaxID=63959 RepID=UPI000361B81B|nr:TetR/AcrR family transcriptional regulator [Demetria terragena]
MPPASTPSRAPALAPGERRQALIEATLRAILELRTSPSTRQIAAAAGVAEGTIFRVFDTKEELIDAAIAQAFDPEPFAEQVAAIDPDLTLRPRLEALVAAVQDRFREVFDVMAALGLTSPPDEHPNASQTQVRDITQRLTDVIRPDAEALRVTPEEVLKYARLLTFSGSHPELTDENPLTPAEITSVLLDGLLIEPGVTGC